MNIDLWQVIVFVASVAATVGITFYVKDYLQSRQEFSKLRTKLENIAGKNATILYNPNPGVATLGLGPQFFKIDEIDRSGITISNDMQTIFIPATKLLQSEMILPAENYEEIKFERLKKDMMNMMDAMAQPMFDKLFPAMLEAMQKHFTDDMLTDGGEMSAVIGIKIKKFLETEGFEIKKLNA